MAPLSHVGIQYVMAENYKSTARNDIVNALRRNYRNISNDVCKYKHFKLKAKEKLHLSRQHVQNLSCRKAVSSPAI